MPKKDQKMVTIRTYSERTEAELAKDYLESCDIDAVVLADDAGGMMPNMTSNIGMARLMVLSDDAEEAESLLEDADAYDDEDDDEDEDEEDDEDLEEEEEADDDSDDDEEYEDDEDEEIDDEEEDDKY